MISISYDVISYDIIIRYVLENFRRTENREQTDPQTENSITETTLIPCGSSGRAGQYLSQIRIEI